MTCGCLSNRKKMIISAQTALIAFIIFNPIVFQAVRNLFGGMIANGDGLPTAFGMILHAALFGLVIYLLMKPTKNFHQIYQPV